MTKISLVEKKVYIYGKSPKEDKDSTFSIYLAPKMLTGVKLSNLEGFFVSENKINLGRHSPRIPFNENQMSEIEKEYQGKFIPFDYSI